MLPRADNLPICETSERSATVAAFARDMGMRATLGSLTEKVSVVSSKGGGGCKDLPRAGRREKKQLRVGDSACGPRKVMPLRIQHWVL